MARAIHNNQPVSHFSLTGTLKQRRTAVAHQGGLLVRELSQQSKPEDLAAALEALQRALGDNKTAEEVPEAAAKTELLTRLRAGRTYSPTERARLELSNLKRSFEFRHQLLEDALTARQVGELLQSKSRQTPHDRRNAGTLLAILDNGIWRFPLWQFDAEGPDGVVQGLPAVLRALGQHAPVSPLQKAVFLTHPSIYLNGRTPLEALKDDEEEKVVDIARSVGVG